MYKIIFCLQHLKEGTVGFKNHQNWFINEKVTASTKRMFWPNPALNGHNRPFLARSSQISMTITLSFIGPFCRFLSQKLAEGLHFQTHVMSLLFNDF